PLLHALSTRTQEVVMKSSVEVGAISTRKLTEIASPQYVQFVTRWQMFAQKTAENALGLGKTLVEAQAALSEEEFERFCKEIGLDQKGATFRKLKKIGEALPRFEPFVQKLPAAWTTLYPLALTYQKMRRRHFVT